MNLNQLLYFSVTARHQHFTRAAEELFVSQPSLSYAISCLEDELGVSLFQKKGRNVTLTQQGRIFLTHVERALSEIQQGREALTCMTHETENRINIAAFSTSLGPADLPTLLQSFSASPQNEDVHFSFTQCADDDMYSGLKSMKYDIAFPYLDEEDPDIEIFPLLTRQLIALVSPTHPLAECASVSLQTLEAHPLIVLRNSPSGLLIRRELPDCKIAGEVQDHLSLMSLAMSGFGIAVCLPTQDTAQSALRAIPIDTPGCRCTIRIAHKKNRYFSPALERFIAYLKSQSEPL